MMPNERFERQLPELLTELAAPRTPDYFDDLLGQTAATRQRPAWTFLERWLPMVDIARQPDPHAAGPAADDRSWAPAHRPDPGHRRGAVIGSRRNVPAPFGPARNGLVAYAQDGDIYTADPVTGKAVAIVTGPETDLGPVCSLDGTRIAFERRWTAPRVRDCSTSPKRMGAASSD